MPTTFGNGTAAVMGGDRTDTLPAVTYQPPREHTPFDWGTSTGNVTDTTPAATTGPRPPAHSGTGNNARRLHDRATQLGGTATIRAWAARNGYTVGPRGTLPNTVLDAYEEAHA